MEGNDTYPSLGLSPTQSANKLDLVSLLFKAMGVRREPSPCGLDMVIFSQPRISLGGRVLSGVLRIPHPSHSYTGKFP